MSTFSFGRRDNYNPNRMSPRVQRNFQFDLNDERFNQPSVEQEQEQSDPYNDIISRYRSILSGDSPALGRYREAMQNMPRREDHDLGRWGKIGAALAGFGAGYNDPSEGIKVATSLREAPYRRALDDYGLELNNLGQEAEFEHQDRANRLKGLDLELESYKDRRSLEREDRLAESLVGRRNFQNRNDARRTGIDEGRFHMDFTNMNADNERDDKLGDSLMNFRTNQNKIGFGNLNARNRALDLDTEEFGHRRETDLLNLGQRQVEERGRNSRSANSGQSWITPSAEDTATDLTLEEVAREFPAWRDFMLITPNYVPEIRKDLREDILNSDAYRSFISEVKGRINRRLNNRRGSDSGSRYEEQ